MDTPPPSSRLAFLFGLAFEASLLGIAWLLGWLLDVPPLDHFRWSGIDLLLGLAATLPMLLVLAAFIRWPIGPLARIRAIVEEILLPWFRSCTLLELALLSLVAGVGEELLFRGVLQVVFCRWLGVALGIAVASVLFGVLHPVTWVYVVLAAACGAYLGLVFQASDNLLVPMVAHALYDFAALVYLLRLSTRPPKAVDVTNVTA